MRKRALICALAATIAGGALVVVAPGGAAEQEPTYTFSTKVPEAKTYWQRQGCRKPYGRADFHRVARKAFAGTSRATKFERRTLNRVTRCQRTEASVLNVRMHRKRYRRAKHRRMVLARLLPYDCGSAGRFSIPCGIVACESGFSWSAYNPSGARGPYQLLDWPVPWPVRTAADRLAHHRMAAKLWAGGAGRSHWVCKG